MRKNRAYCDTPLLKEGEAYERIKQEGRREVVEFVSTYKLHASNISIPGKLWQAFIKGIEK